MNEPYRVDWRKELEEAKDKHIFIKLILMRPSTNRILKKSGYVKQVYDDDKFDFDELYDGHVTFSRYDIIAIIGISRGGENAMPD